MYLLDDPWRKNMLLDILAYFLWDKKTAKFFSSFPTKISKCLAIPVLPLEYITLYICSYLGFLP
jgi:hypothetical protein